MAEIEVIKHGEKLVRAGRNRERSFWHKLREIILEILIIVFAVTLSIWLHERSEHHKEQKQVKEFLLGLKGDIQDDINETRNLISSYKVFDTVYTYLSSLTAKKIPDKDSLKMFLSKIVENAFLRPNTSRFNGFLSAGKILNIERDSLIQNILDFYQEIIPRMKSSEGFWVDNNARLQTYMVDNVKDFDSDKSRWEVLITPKGKYLCRSLIPWRQLFERYENLITAGESIIEQINYWYEEK